jgi:hypothetical protein
MNAHLAVLQIVADNLWLQSETDAPLEIYEPGAAWESLEYGAALSGATRVCFEKFFEPLMMPEGWENAEEIAICERWHALYNAMRENLTQCSVWKRDGNVYILGRLPDGTAGGLKTRVVET